MSTNTVLVADAKADLADGSDSAAGVVVTCVVAGDTAVDSVAWSLDVEAAHREEAYVDKEAKTSGGI